jgi:hypothetical protein
MFLRIQYELVRCDVLINLKIIHSHKLLPICLGENRFKTVKFSFGKWIKVIFFQIEPSKKDNSFIYKAIFIDVGSVSQFNYINHQADNQKISRNAQLIASLTHVSEIQ